MTKVALVLRWAMAIAAMVWAIAVLPNEFLRIHYSGIREAITTGVPIKPEQLAGAIGGYETINKLGFCQPALREQLASFYLHRSAHAPSLSPEQKAADLARAEALVRETLTCSPLASDQWLSLALIDQQRHGLGSKTATYLEMSYLTAPREYWVVERRLAFSAGLGKSFPHDLRHYLDRDIEVLRHHKPTKPFLDRFQLETVDDFVRLFDGV